MTKLAAASAHPKGSAFLNALLPHPEIQISPIWLGLRSLPRVRRSVVG